MKYFQMTAYTPYCGEELTSYEMAESEEELYTSGKADALIDDCINSYMKPLLIQLFGKLLWGTIHWSSVGKLSVN